MSATAAASDFNLKPAIRVLVVDDDNDLRDLISNYLKANELVVETASQGRDMDKILKRAEFDIIVLDVMMPGEDGLSICRRLNDEAGPAILMLSAKAEEIDRIVGLELGADDYLAKPFHPRELLARIRAVMRRREARSSSTDKSPFTHFFGWSLDNIKRTLTRPDGVMVALSNAEFELLRVFLDRPGRALSRDQILEFLHGHNTESFDRAIDVQISRLRRKLDTDAQGEDIIRTIRGIGYMFKPY
jgi:two-component system, OmpR family, response regulator